MGFWKPRAICPNCGSKIHTQDALPGPPLPGGGIQRTGTQCPQCGIPLTGKVGFLSNTAQIDQARVQQQRKKTATAEAGQRSRADELEKLAKLRKDGVLTEEEFSAAKGRVLSGPETYEETSGGGAMDSTDSEPEERFEVILTGVEEKKRRRLASVVEHWTNEPLKVPMAVTPDSKLSKTAAETLKGALEKRGAAVELRKLD
jgi:hypothetical protein